MPRLKLYPFAAVPLAVLAACLGACGGDDAEPTKTTDTAGDTPLPLLSTATPVPSDGPALNVVLANGKSLVPTIDELKKLPTAEINADGNKKGITIDSLAKLVEANPAALVTMQGVRADGKTVAFVRAPLSDLATSTVLVIDDTNHLSIASTKLKKEEWLQAIVSVAFENR